VVTVIDRLGHFVSGGWGEAVHAKARRDFGSRKGAKDAKGLRLGPPFCFSETLPSLFERRTTDRCAIDGDRRILFASFAPLRAK
jgi:hypothetical protein